MTCSRGSYDCRFNLDEYDRITHLIWVHPKSLNLVRCFPHVLLMDCTYKTNKFKVPLLSIIRITATYSSFFVAFAFLQTETQESYQWVLEELRRTCTDISPSAIVTDRELALINELEVSFPESKHVLCRWHISNNILAKCKAAFRDDETWSEFSKTSWSRLMVSKTEEECESRWNALRSADAAQGNVVQYLEETWWPHCERFVESPATIEGRVRRGLSRRPLQSKR